MTSAPFIVDPALFERPFCGDAMPIGLVDLASASDVHLVLPPFPLVGFGDPGHPLAAQLDAVIEPPVTLAGLTRNVVAKPVAAAVAVQLLRLVGALPIEAGLVAESIAYGLLQAGAEHAAWRATRPPAAAAGAGRIRADRKAERLDIELQRAQAHNAIDRTMRDALREAFELAALDTGIARIVLRGEGRAFCIGAELSEFGTTLDPAAAHSIRMRTLPAHAIARCSMRLEAHVQGACVGAGLEMAAFAERVVARSGAWFQLPELAMGLVPGAGGCVSVTRRIGRRRAALLILSGRRIDARTALDWGLVDSLVDE